MVDDQDAAFLAESMRLGKVIAEMHLALASGAPGSEHGAGAADRGVAQHVGEQR